MISPSCVKLIETAALQVPGIISASVTLNPSRGIFKFDPQITGPRKMISIIQNLGYGCSLITREDAKNGSEQKAEIQKWRRTFLISLLFGIPVLVVMTYFHWVQGTQHGMNQILLFRGLSLDNFLLFLFCTPVQVKKSEK